MYPVHPEVIRIPPTAGEMSACTACMDSTYKKLYMNHLCTRSTFVRWFGDNLKLQTTFRFLRHIAIRLNYKLKVRSVCGFNIFTILINSNI